MSESPSLFAFPADLIFEVLDVLRLAHIYALKDSHPEALPPDFKPWKWDGFEIDHAQKASDCYRRMIKTMEAETE